MYLCNRISPENATVFVIRPDSVLFTFLAHPPVKRDRYACLDIGSPSLEDFVLITFYFLILSLNHCLNLF